MSDDNVIKFGKARKSLAQKAKKKKAAENRARFGLKKAEKEKRAELTRHMQNKLDGHKVEKQLERIDDKLDAHKIPSPEEE